MHRAWPGLLLALAVLLAWPVLLGDRVWLPRHSEAVDLPWSRMHTGERQEPRHDAFSDKVNLLWPDAAFIEHQARHHGDQGWNPLILGGSPTAANPLTAVHSPITWALRGLPALRALAVSAALHLLILGIGIYALLRQRGVHPAAATVAGAQSMLCGWVAAHLPNVPLVAVVAFWPWGILGLFWIRGGRFRVGLLAIAGSIALQLRAGFPQTAVYGAVALATSGLLLLLRPATASTRLRFLTVSLAGAILGLLLAAGPLLEIRAALAWSGHQTTSPASLVNESFRSGGFLGLAMPYALGDFGGRFPNGGDALARALLGEGPELHAPAIMGWGERTLYLGWPVLLVALLGLRARGLGLRSLCLGLILLGALLSSVPEIITAAGHFTPFSVGAPARAIVLIVFGLLGLSGLGFHQVIVGLPRSISGVALGLTSLVALLAGGLAILARVDGTMASDGLLRVLEWTGLGDRLPTPAPPRAELVAFLGKAQPLWEADACRLAFLSLGAGLALLLVRRQRRVLAALILAGLVITDLGLFFAHVNRPVRSEGLFEATPAIAHLQATLGPSRFMRVSPTEVQAVAEVPHLLAPNLGMLWGLRDAQGYREQVRQEYVALWTGVAALTRDVGVSGIAADRFDSPILDLLAVRILIAQAPIESLAAHRITIPGAVSEDLCLYENTDAQPRAWFVGQARSLPGSDLVPAIQSGAVAFREELVIPARDGLFVDPGVRAEGSVRLARDEASKIDLEVECARPGYVILADTFDSGWSARIRNPEGSATEAEILPAFGCLRAVAVPAGRCTIEWRFVSAQRTGALVGLTGGAMLLAWLLYWYRPRRSIPVRIEPSA